MSSYKQIIQNPIFALTLINLFAHAGFGWFPGYGFELVSQVILAEFGCLVSCMSIEHSIESVGVAALEVLSNSKLYAS